MLMIKILTACTIVASTFALTGCAKINRSNTISQTNLNKPNIIYILTDDLSYGDVGCMNSASKIKPPIWMLWPKVIAAGTKYDETICLTDLLATAADITNTRLPDNGGEDSVTLLPYMSGDNKGALKEATVHYSINGSFAISKASGNSSFALTQAGGARQVKKKRRQRFITDTTL